MGDVPGSKQNAPERLTDQDPTHYQAPVWDETQGKYIPVDIGTAIPPGTILHNDLGGVTADQHHTESHTLASHSTKAHVELTGVGANDHHAQNHSDTQHTDGPNSKPGHTHSHATDLTSVTADQHHAQSHTHASHTGIGADDHHTQSHTHASHTGIGADDHHTQSHSHASHTGVGANDHHNQSHSNSDHSAAGTPSTSAVGDAAATGSSTSDAKSDHTHGREAFAAPVATGTANASGSNATIPRSDHVHLAPGTLGYAQVTSNQGTFTADTDLTSLTITFTPGSGRRILLIGMVNLSSSVAGDTARLNLKEGATVLYAANVAEVANGTPYPVIAVAILTPTNASHTYKLSAQRVAGTGNITMQANANQPAFIWAFDIGT